MSDEGWTVCVDPRKQKRNQRRIEQEQCPHLIRTPRARQLQRKLNIDNLATTLLEDAAYQLQIEGWIYTRVLRPSDSYNKEDGWEYTTIDNFNEWDDKLLFRRMAFDRSPTQAPASLKASNQPLATLREASIPKSDKTESPNHREAETNL